MEKPPEKRPLMLFLPAGTGTNVCRSLGISADSFADSLKNATIAYLDVGKVKAGENTVKYFLNVVAWGLAADGAFYAEHPWLRFAGGLRYDIASLFAISEGKVRRTELICDGVRSPVVPKVMFLMVNQHCGNAWRIAPFSVMNDGMFGIINFSKLDLLIIAFAFSDISIAQDCEKLRLASMLMKTKSKGCQHVYDPNMSMYRSKKVAIQSTPGSALYVDGELYPEVHEFMEFEMLPRVLPLLIPNSLLKSFF
jgi:diacylglycerol kinase family enzyme